MAAVPKFVLAFGSLVIWIQAFAQPALSIAWQRALGGSNVDQAISVQQTTDGGYIVAGMTGSNDGDVTGNHGSADAWLVKLDDNGTVEWQKAYGGSAADGASAVRQTSDGGYMVVGVTSSNDGDVSGLHSGQDMWVIKVDPFGTLQWQKCLGGSTDDWAGSVQQTSDGGYVISGTTTSNDGDVTGNHGSWDCWVVKLDGSGVLQWQRAIGGSDMDGAGSIQQTSDGGYVLAGGTFSNDGDVSGNHGVQDLWVIKLDGAGVLQWQRTLGGSSHDLAYSIEQTTDGGYVAAGLTSSSDGDVTGYHGASDIWMVKLDAIGLLQWQKALGGTAPEFANSVRVADDGGYLLAGQTQSNDGDVSGNHGDKDFWLVKIDTTGAILWQKALGGSDEDIPFSVIETSDGGYVVAGHTKSNDGDVTGNHGLMDQWVVKLQALEVGVSLIDTEGYAVAPNPCLGIVHILGPSPVVDARVTITDALGREVLARALVGSTCALDLTDQRPGLYLVTIRSAQGVRCLRLVLE